MEDQEPDAADAGEALIASLAAGLALMAPLSDAAGAAPIAEEALSDGVVTTAGVLVVEVLLVSAALLQAASAVAAARAAAMAARR
jgi:hypothetical protein